MKYLYIVISVPLILCWILIGRYFCLKSLESHIKRQNNAIKSAEVNLGENNIFQWKITESEWKNNYGILDLYIHFQKTSELIETELWSRYFDLDIKLNSYAITLDKVKANRLINNQFFPTDEPFKVKKDIWSGWGDEEAKIKIGKIIRFPREDLNIELIITKPDRILSKASTVLILSQEYDSAVLGYIPLLRLIANIFMLIGVAAVLFLAVLSWRYAQIKNITISGAARESHEKPQPPV